MLELVTRVRGGNIQANQQLVREMYGQGPQGNRCCIDANGDGIITFEGMSSCSFISLSYIVVVCIYTDMLTLFEK